MYSKTKRKSIPASVALRAIGAICFFLTPPSALAEEPVHFNRDIRGILSDNCFFCHGPDEAERKAGLRLDQRESAIDHGAIVPSDTSASELVARITSDDPNVQMPPPESNRELTNDEIDLLRRWIDEGAEYMPHWSFIPVDDPAVPKIDSEWPRDTIDNFILQRLNEEGIEPSPTADKETLIRRVSLDLTGLPPTVAEVDAFLKDNSPNAYEKVVDRLLASPAYGERMALEWMDVARYADTFGYQNDKPNHVWPWRDWVIEAFNENLPYDQFITWQLAGDLLEAPSQDQLVATAFNRLHRQTNEGGSINEEFRVEYVVDRTNTVGQAFLGLTMECARCHDHKFDPISAEDYYSLSAFFDDIDESGLYSHFTDATPTPSTLLYNDGQREKHEQLKQAIHTEESNLAAVSYDAIGRFQEWLQNPDRPTPKRDPIVHWPLNELEQPEGVSLIQDPQLIDGPNGKAFQFDGENGVQADLADFDRYDPFTMSLWLKTGKHVSHTVVAHRTKAELDAGSRGYELLLRDGKPTFSLIHFWPGNAIRVMARDPIPTSEWVHITATYDGSSRADGITLYINGQPVALDIVRDKLTKTLHYDHEGNKPNLTLASRFRDVGFKNGAIDDFRMFDAELTEVEVKSMATSADFNVDAFNENALTDYYLHVVDDKYKAQLAKLRDARKAESDFVESLGEIMVMRDMAEPRQAYLLERGMYDQRAQPVSPDTPEAIMSMPKQLPDNRLGLAQWLTHPDHPLTSRVAVNRYWQLFFGRGLVETQEDFGTQGKPPSHPELLDYLAHEFMASGWNLKALHKRIVMSATYRQDSTPRPELDDRDPFNILLARGPRFRLPAEMVRDSALASSGLLTETVGGPSVKPYQPEGLWKEASSYTYTPDSGDALYRRSMYTFWRRTVPPPNMLTFDATNRDVCTVRRERTTTPLQALVLLNDPQFVEASRALAAAVIEKDDATIKDQLVALFRRVTSRRPSDAELAVLQDAYNEQRAYFAERPDEAAAYVETGESPVPESADHVELAAATAVAQAVMNLDEFQVRR